jgi:SAM-dependent methyltransferase
MRNHETNPAFPDNVSLKQLDLVRDYLDPDIKGAGRPYAALGFNQEAPAFRKMIQTFDLTGFNKVVDVGCGYGRWSFFLSEVNEEVIGYDISPLLINVAENLRVRLFRNDNVHFQVSPAAKLPLEDGVADAGFLHGVTFSVSRPDIFLELHRVVATGGTVFVGAFNAIGKIIEGLVRAYSRGGFEDRNYQMYRKAALSGPFAPGPETYATSDTRDPIMHAYGFAVDRTRPVLDFKQGRLDPVEERLCRDLAHFVHEFEENEEKREWILRDVDRLKHGVEFDFHFCATRI